MLLYLAQEITTPMGPDFGKASPLGMFVIVVLLAIVVYLGYCLSRRVKTQARRRAFAEANGLDPFDLPAIDAAMKAAGVADVNAKRHLL